ncbi:MAG TPA: hypothetical protein VIY08_11030 [Candidatus Nitrosocosmicus sp.]
MRYKILKYLLFDLIDFPKETMEENIDKLKTMTEEDSLDYFS